MRIGPLRVILAVGFFSSLAFAAVPATFALYANRVLFPDLADPGRTQLYIGLMLTFNGLMQVVTQLALLKPLVSRLGERKLLLLGMGALLVASVGVASAESALVVTLLFAPFAFGRGVSEPSLQSLTTRFGDERTRGQLLGLYQSARSLALIFGPVWAGYRVRANQSPGGVLGRRRPDPGGPHLCGYPADPANPPVAVAGRPETARGD